MRKIRHLFIVVALLLGSLGAFHVEAQRLRAGNEVTIKVDSVLVPDICGNVLTVTIYGKYDATVAHSDGFLIATSVNPNNAFDSFTIPVEFNQTGTEIEFEFASTVTLQDFETSNPLSPGSYGIRIGLDQNTTGTWANFDPPISGDTYYFTVKTLPGSLPAEITVPAACPGATVTIPFPGIVNGATVSWSKQSGGEVGLADGSGTAGADGYTISFTAAANNTNAPITATYAVTAYLDGCTVGGTFTVTVNPKPAISVSSTEDEACSGGALNYQFSSTTGLAGITYSYIYNGGGSNILSGAGEIGANGVFQPTVNHPGGTAPLSPVTGNYRAYAVSADGCVSDTIDFSATVNPVPAIVFTSGEEDGVVALCNGETYTGGQTYQTNVSGAEFTVISVPVDYEGNWSLNATDRTITLGDFTPTESVVFKIIAAANGCESDTTTFAVTVNTKPVITLINKVDTVCSVGTVSYVFSSNIANVTYHIGFITGGNDILSGAAFVDSTLSYVVTHPKSGDAPFGPLTGEYKVWAVSGDGCSSDTIDISATVNPIPVLTLLGQNSLNLCYGVPYEGAIYVSDVAGAEFLVNGGTLATPWEQRGDTLYYNSASVTIGGDYEISATAGECASSTAAFNVTVGAEITLGLIPAQTVCSGGDITPVDVLGEHSSGATSYDWEITSSFTGGFSPTSGTGETDNLALTNLVNGTEADSTIVVSITPKNGDCSGTAIEFSITVKPAIQLTSVEDIVLCDGSPFEGIDFEATPGVLTFGLTNNARENENSNKNLIFSLNTSRNGIDSISSVSISKYASDRRFRVVQEYVLTASNGLCAAIDTFKVTIYPSSNVSISHNLAGRNTDPDYGPIPVVFGLRPDSIYPADMPIVTFRASNTSVTGFRWEKTGGDWVGLDLEGYAPATDRVGSINGGWRTIKNLTGHTVCGTYRVWPVIEGENGEELCEGKPEFFYVCVAPVPTDVENGRVDDIANVEVCSHLESPAFAFTGNLAPKGTYRWELQSVDPEEGFEGEFPLIGTSLTFPSFRITNTTSDPVVATYKVTPQYGDNILVDDSAKTFTVTILPAPAILPVITDIRAESGDTIRFVLDNPDNLVFEAEQVSGDHVGELSISGNIFGGTAVVNTGDETLTAVYRISPKYSEEGCAGEPRLFTVYIDPAGLDNLIVSPVESQAVCYGSGLEDINFSSYRTDGLELPATSYLVEFVGGVDVINLGVNPDLQQVDETGIWAISGVSELVSGTGTYRVTPRSVNGEGKSIVFSLTVGADLEAIELVLENRTYKNGDLVPVFPLTSGAIVLPEGVSIVWRHNESSDVLKNLQLNGSNEMPAFEAVNTGSTPLIATFNVEIVGSDNCVRILERAFSITVLPSKVEDINLSMTPVAGQIVCDGQRFEPITLTAVSEIYNLSQIGQGEISYIWEFVSGTHIVGGETRGIITNRNAGSTNAVWNINEGNVWLFGKGVYSVTPVWNNGQGIAITVELQRYPGLIPALKDKRIIAYNGQSVDAIALEFDRPIDMNAGIQFSYRYAYYLDENGWPVEDANKFPIGIVEGGYNIIPAFKAYNPTDRPILATIALLTYAGSDINSLCRTDYSMEILVLPNTVDDLDLVMREIEDVTICSGEEVPYPALVAFDRITGIEYKNGVVAFDVRLVSGVDILDRATTNTTTGVVSGTYMVIPFLNNNQGVPAMFTISVKPEPVASPIADIVTLNGAHVAAINLTGIGTSFGWTSEGSVGNGLFGFNTIEAFTAINTGSVDTTAVITVTPMFDYCEGEPMTFNITVKPNTVDDLDLVMREIADVTICSDTEILPPALIAYDRITGIDYEDGVVAFEVRLVSGVDILFGGSINTTTDVVSGTYMVIPFLNNNQGVPEMFTISVNPVPVANQIADITTVNGAYVAAINLSGIGTSFGWSVTGNEIGCGHFGVNTIEAFTALNPGAADSIATFTVIPRLGACEGEPMIFNVTVKPNTVDDLDLVMREIADVTICSDTEILPPALIAYDRITGIDYEDGVVAFEVRLVSGVDILFGGSINTTTGVVSGTYMVIPFLNNNQGVPTTFTISVNPVPVANQIADITTVNGAYVAAINLSGIGTSFGWSVTGNEIGCGHFGVNTIEAFTALNPGAADSTATFTVIPRLGACEGEPMIFSITVKPGTVEDKDLVADPVEPQYVCSGERLEDINFSAYRTDGGDLLETSYRVRFIGGTDVINLGANPEYQEVPEEADGLWEISRLTELYTGTGTYSVTPRSMNGEGVPAIFTLTIGFNLNFINLSAVEDRVYRNGDQVPVFPLTSIAALPENISIAWSLNEMSQRLINLQSKGFDRMPAFEAVNTGSIPVLASFDLQLIDNTTGCSGEIVRNAFSITIIPNTVSDLDFAMDGISDQTVCSNAPIADIAYGSSYRFAELEGFDPADVYYETKLLSGVHVLAEATVDIAGTDAGYTGNVIENRANHAVSGTYIVTPLWRNKEGKPSTFTITVLPVPTVVKPLDQVLCNNTMSQPVVFNGSVQGVEYAWTVVDAEGNPIASQIGLPDGLNIGNMPAYQVANATGDQLTDWIEVVSRTATSSESGEFCYGTSALFTITVNPTPVVTPVANITVNPGAVVPAINIAGLTDAAYTTYKWTNSNTLIGLNLTEGTNTIPEFIATNESNGKLQSVVTVYPSYTKDGLTCNGEAITFTIIVNARPVISPIEDRIVCNGEKVAAIDLQARVTDAVYFIWTSSINTIGLADNPDPATEMTYIPAFNAIYDESIGNGNDLIVSTVTVTPFVSSNGVVSEGAPFSFTISVKPTTRISVQPAIVDAACETQSISLSVVASGYNLKYQWYRNGAAIGRFENESALTANLVIDDAKISDAGTYFVLVSGDCNELESARVEVEVNLNPSLIVQKWNDVLMVNADANTNGGYRFTSYQWFKNGNRLAGEVMPNYHETSVNTNDVYQVALNTPSGTFMSCPTRLQVFDSNIMLSVYPNPVYAGEVVTVQANLPSTANLNTLKLQVINTAGHVHSSTAGTGTYTQVTMPTTPGVYVLRAIYEDSNQGSVLREFKVIVK